MKKAIIPGLMLYCVVSGLGLFLDRGLSSRLVVPWLAGFLLLASLLSYAAVFTKVRTGLFFLVLGVIAVNFSVQITGGPASLLLPAYFLLTASAALRHRVWAYPVAALAIAVEAANLLHGGNARAQQWISFGGFAAALAGVAFITSRIAHRIQSEAKIVLDSYEKLLSDADSVDPLAGGTNVEALTEKQLQATYVSVAREREGAFSALFDTISSLVPSHTCALFLDDRDRGVFSLRGIRSHSRFLAPGTVEFARGNGLIGICAAQSEPQYLPSMVIPPKSLGYYTQNVPVKSFIAIPFVQEGRVTGVLAVDSLEQDAFPAGIQETLTRLIPFFSQIIDRTRVSVEMDMRAKNFAALHAMSSVLSSSLEISEVLDKLAGQLGSVVPYDFCAFLTVDEHAGEADIIALKGYESRFAGARFPVSQSAILTHMVKQWQDRRLCSVHHDPDLGDRGREIGLFPIKELQQPLKTLFGRPLVARDKFIGAAFLGSIRTNIFTEYHRNFLDTLMNQVSMVVDNSMLHQRICDMARTDGLTGLLNHRTFMEKLGEECRRIDRDPRPFSILLMDIDKFKGVNDKYGHPVGDVAIKTVARVLRETGRQSDFVARYGGEEFAVGMVDTDVRGAQKTGERIRKIVEKTLVSRVPPDGELRITVSIGVSSFPEDTRDPYALVTLADNALYQAKRSGRNRVCLFRDVRDSERDVRQA